MLRPLATSWGKETTPSAEHVSRGDHRLGVLDHEVVVVPDELRVVKLDPPDVDRHRPERLVGAPMVPSVVLVLSPNHLHPVTSGREKGLDRSLRSLRSFWAFPG
jgi:hypothetical protein